MSEEQAREEQREDQHPVPFSQTLGFGAGTMLAAGMVDLLAHLGPTGLVVGGIVAYVAAQHGPELYEQVRDALPSPAPGVSRQPGKEQKSRQHGSSRSLIDRALGRFPEEDLAVAETEQDAEGKDDLPAEDASSGDPIFSAHTKADAPAIARLTIESIVRHVERNSYTIYIGRSLTRPGNPAVQISIYQRHFKLIGASQKGKSSMAAAFLDIVTRTHDTDHVLVALLDLEDQTSKLFAHLPHLATVRFGDKHVRLHARSREQVLEHLSYLLAIMEHRYALSKLEIAQQPILLVYVEEFLALKDYFKRRIDAVRDQEKEQAKKDYAQLIFAISELARRGLKARVQLILCAQVDYRDEDLQEALINITAGMSFSVRVTAALAAGFYNADLLRRNAVEDRVGQAVIETPDGNDLVLAPDFDLEQRLIAFEEAELEQERLRQKRKSAGEHSPRLTAAPGQQALAHPGAPRLSPFPRIDDRSQEDDDEEEDDWAAKYLPEEPEPGEYELSGREKQYELVLDAWAKGIRSIRSMMEPLGLNFNQTRELLEEMDDLGLILWRKKGEKANV